MEKFPNKASTSGCKSFFFPLGKAFEESFNVLASAEAIGARHETGEITLPLQDRVGDKP
jgi:hypothetical protein